MFSLVVFGKIRGPLKLECSSELEKTASPDENQLQLGRLVKYMTAQCSVNVKRHVNVSHVRNACKCKLLWKYGFVSNADFYLVKLLSFLTASERTVKFVELSVGEQIMHECTKVISFSFAFAIATFIRFGLLFWCLLFVYTLESQIG